MTWAHGVEVVLKKEGFSELRDTEIGGRFGKLKCIEAVQYRDATRITSACLNMQSKILSTLEGAPPDIPELYEIVASTQAITNSVR